MSRSYGTVRPRANLVYSVDEVMRLYGVCRNTVSNWVQSGLPPVDRKAPQLFRGATLIQFHEDRRARSKQELRSGEFKCFGCKAAVFPEIETLGLQISEVGGGSAAAKCPDCGAAIMKYLDATECDKLAFILQMPRHLPHAVERGVQKLLVDQKHEVEVHRRLTLRRVIE